MKKEETHQRQRLPEDEGQVTCPYFVILVLNGLVEIPGSRLEIDCS